MSLAEIVAWSVFCVFIGWLVIVFWATLRTVRSEAREAAKHRQS